jgi:mannan endo-1,4-beta-mannosidase
MEKAKSRATLALAALLAVTAAALVPAAAASASVAQSARLSSSSAAHSKAVTAPLPFGLFQGTNNARYSFPVTPAYAIQYYGWNEPFQTADAQAAWNAGTETFAELQTCGNPCNASTSVPIASVINGTYDSYLVKFAEAVAAFGHPVLLTFDHEMNGAWYPWGSATTTPAQWIAAWQHVTSVVSAIAANATWVWVPNIEQGAASVASYWPGNGYASAHVNMVGLDGYFQNSGSTWANTFSQSVRDAMAASGGLYPFVVAETGVPSADSNGVSQIDNLVAGARSAGAVALMYFDSGTRWALSPAEQSEFARDVR